MNLDDIKHFIKENQRGLIVGAIAGFVLATILR